MGKYIYKGKEEKVVLESALKELNIPESEILIKTKEEKGGLFSGKKVVVEIVKIEDISEFGKTILENTTETKILILSIGTTTLTIPF